MKTGFDILEKVYKIINVSGITSKIGGRIYRRAKPPNRQLQDIVVLTLPIMGSPDVQTSTVIINIYCINNQYGLSDETKLNTITDAVITVLEAYNQQSDGSYFDFDLNNSSENTMLDTDQPIMSYTSLRVVCNIQKK